MYEGIVICKTWDAPRVNDVAAMFGGLTGV